MPQRLQFTLCAGRCHTPQARSLPSVSQGRSDGSRGRPSWPGSQLCEAAGFPACHLAVAASPRPPPPSSRDFSTPRLPRPHRVSACGLPIRPRSRHVVPRPT